MAMASFLQKGKGVFAFGESLRIQCTLLYGVEVVAQFICFIVMYENMLNVALNSAELPFSSFAVMLLIPEVDFLQDPANPVR